MLSQITRQFVRSLPKSSVLAATQRMAFSAVEVKPLNVLVADKFSEAGMAELKKQGMNLHYDANLNGDSLIEALNEHKPEVLVVRSTKVPAQAVDAASPNLSLVLRAGAGYDTIDWQYCSTRSVYVANCAGMNSHAVAELAMGLMLSVDRRIPDGNALLKQGIWKKGEFAKCRGIKGRNFGIIGFGNIGQLVANRANGFEMNVLVDNMFPEAGLDKEMNFEYMPRDELLAESDFLTLHVPSVAATKGMINKDFLNKMKPDAVLLNTSRGAVMNEADILEHLEANPNFWLGTDVFPTEPAGGKAVPFESPLSKHPRVVGTHHIGASTMQSEAAIGDEAVRILKNFAKTGSVDKASCVNMARKGDEQTFKVSIRHLDKEGVLAFCFSTFYKFGWNVCELENVVFDKRQACATNIIFKGEPNGTA